MPPLQRTLHDPVSACRLDSFPATLSTRQDPRFLEPLGHLVEPTAPAGEVAGLVRATFPSPAAAGSPPRLGAGGPPAAATPSVQRTEAHVADPQQSVAPLDDAATTRPDTAPTGPPPGRTAAPPATSATSVQRTPAVAGPQASPRVVDTLAAPVTAPSSRQVDAAVPAERQPAWVEPAASVHPVPAAPTTDPDGGHQVARAVVSRTVGGTAARPVATPGPEGSEPLPGGGPVPGEPVTVTPVQRADEPTAAATPTEPAEPPDTLEPVERSVPSGASETPAAVERVIVAEPLPVPEPVGPLSDPRPDAAPDLGLLGERPVQPAQSSAPASTGSLPEAPRRPAPAAPLPSPPRPSESVQRTVGPERPPVAPPVAPSVARAVAPSVAPTPGPDHPASQPGHADATESAHYSEGTPAVELLAERPLLAEVPSPAAARPAPGVQRTPTVQRTPRSAPLVAPPTPTAPLGPPGSLTARPEASVAEEARAAAAPVSGVLAPPAVPARPLLTPPAVQRITDVVAPPVVHTVSTASKLVAAGEPGGAPPPVALPWAPAPATARPTVRTLPSPGLEVRSVAAHAPASLPPLQRVASAPVAAAARPGLPAALATPRPLVASTTVTAPSVGGGWLAVGPSSAPLQRSTAMVRGTVGRNRPAPSDAAPTITRSLPLQRLLAAMPPAPPRERPSWPTEAGQDHAVHAVHADPAAPDGAELGIRWEQQPEPTLQRVEDGDPSPQPPADDDAAAAVATAAATAPATTVPAAPAPGGPDLDELARRLYGPVSALLRAELWLDRERSGRSLTR